MDISSKRTSEISHEKIFDMLKKRGNLKRESESLLIAQRKNQQQTNKHISTHYIKTKIDQRQQNCRCRLCHDRDETINHIIIECSKFAQKEYNTRHDWVGNVIHLGLSKKIHISPYEQEVYAQLGIRPGE